MQKEEVLNAAIGELLRSYLHNSTVHVEENNQLNDPLKRPDFTIVREGRETLLVENKIESEKDLIDQCKERFKYSWADGSPIRAVVGLLSPQITVQSNGGKKIASNDFRWAVWHSNSDRFPAQGWLHGSLLDFSGFIDRVGTNAVNIDELVDKIRMVLRQTSLIVSRSQKTSDQFSIILKQETNEQTNRMGLAMIFNALVFQSHIAQHHSAIKSPSQMMGNQNINQASLSQTWKQILDIDYSPIFLIARELLQSFSDAGLADTVLDRMIMTAIDVAKETGSQGLIGTIFGELISDRKLLASFYTMPQSAALMAELSVGRLDIAWNSRKQIESLKIGDFAVGTGTLLVAAYKRIAERYLLTQNDPSELHRPIMENIMIGCDVDPSAVHITASRLSGEYPNINYFNTQTYVMPFGRMKLKKRVEVYKLGSLDLFDDSPQVSLFGSGLEALSSAGITSHADVNISNESLDLIIMNPPYIRSTGQEGFKEGIPNPAFAGLGNTEEEQKQMSKILSAYLNRLPRLRASHGNAGLVSNFMDLAHIKLKPGGILALITPMTVVSGGAWSNMRELLAREYRNITIISPATNKKHGRNWSADTGLNEVMIIAQKNKEKERNLNTEGSAQFITLSSELAIITQAIELGKKNTSSI